TKKQSARGVVGQQTIIPTHQKSCPVPTAPAIKSRNTTHSQAVLVRTGTSPTHSSIRNDNKRPSSRENQRAIFSTTCVESTAAARPCKKKEVKSASFSRTKTPTSTHNHFEKHCCSNNNFTGERARVSRGGGTNATKANRAVNGINGKRHPQVHPPPDGAVPQRPN
ncbi:unnamed protein product, partial [Ectocarpus sp. 12 AP-2014]